MPVNYRAVGLSRSAIPVPWYHAELEKARNIAHIGFYFPQMLNGPTYIFGSKDGLYDGFGLTEQSQGNLIFVANNYRVSCL